MKFILVFAILFFSFTCACSGSEVFQNIKFSRKHSAAETKIRKTFQSEIEEAHLLNPENPVSIEIAMTDLNNDGKEEIFAFMGGNPYFCGVHGCGLLVFRDGRIDKNSVVLNTTANHVEISNRKTKGFKNIRLEEKSVWKWTGDRYK